MPVLKLTASLMAELLQAGARSACRPVPLRGGSKWLKLRPGCGSSAMKLTVVEDRHSRERLSQHVSYVRVELVPAGTLHAPHGGAVLQRDASHGARGPRH